MKEIDKEHLYSPLNAIDLAQSEPRLDQKETNLMNYQKPELQNITDSIKEQYEARLQSLHEQIALISENINQDEILSAMKEDSASNEFRGQRIKVNIESNN